MSSNGNGHGKHPKETPEARRQRLEEKLDSDRPLEIADDEVTDVIELASLRLRESHDKCTKKLRETIAKVEAELEKG